jgi:HTH-type transcriptional regulator/antitoxin MqsA
MPYRGATYTYSQPGDYCEDCGEGFLTPEDLDATFIGQVEFKRQCDRLLSPSEVLEIRKTLGITQAQAGDLFGGGINAFSRYERGEVEQSRALDLLLRLLRSGNLDMRQILEPERVMYRVSSVASGQGTVVFAMNTRIGTLSSVAKYNTVAFNGNERDFASRPDFEAAV